MVSKSRIRKTFFKCFHFSLCTCRRIRPCRNEVIVTQKQVKIPAEIHLYQFCNLNCIAIYNRIGSKIIFDTFLGLTWWFGKLKRRKRDICLFFVTFASQTNNYIFATSILFKILTLSAFEFLRHCTIALPTSAVVLSFKYWRDQLHDRTLIYSRTLILTWQWFWS